MDIKTKLKEAQKRQQELVDRINDIRQEKANLTQQEQMLLQEAIRCEGEIKVLKELNGEKGGKS